MRRSGLEEREEGITIKDGRLSWDSEVDMIPEGRSDRRNVEGGIQAPVNFAEGGAMPHMRALPKHHAQNWVIGRTSRDVDKRSRPSVNKLEWEMFSKDATWETYRRGDIPSAWMWMMSQ